MEAAGNDKKHVYSVWGAPPNDVRDRLKKLMDGLRSEFGGPEFQPHVTVVGAITLTEQDALSKFNSACEGLKAYLATVVEASSHCSGHFGYKSSTPYMPHLSLLYGDLTDEEKKKAQEKALQLDDSINSLSFEISSLELWKTDTEDNSLKSWEKISEFNLSPN
ncbi:unnamed protein product [Linum tenue]|uniref:RNA ligase/cyclic nucleotide phosphodiesterase family protein n=1 Tax=Linum tenue TaxID=586396 RepID=A0AAV0PWQ0_9ROSI|nr:unnamed protein product [Linum tenue]